LRFAAGAVHQPDLRAELLVIVVAARREEREIAVVGTPPRHPLARLGCRGEPDLLGAVPARHPQIGIAFVLLHVYVMARMGEPPAGRRDLRIAEGAQPGEILERDRTFGCLSLWRPGQHGNCDAHDDNDNALHWLPRRSAEASRYGRVYFASGSGRIWKRTT